MDQTSVLLKLNYLMGLANASSAAGRSGRLVGPEAMSAADWPANMTSSPFNFSADTAAGLIEDYLANMFTVSQPATIALLCLYAPVFLFSLAGNSFVIVMFVKDRRMRRVKSLFLVNLALVRSRHGNHVRLRTLEPTLSAPRLPLEPSWHSYTSALLVY